LPPERNAGRRRGAEAKQSFIEHSLLKEEGRGGRKLQEQRGGGNMTQKKREKETSKQKKERSKKS